MLNTHGSQLLGKDDVFIVTTLDGSDTLYSRSYGASYHSTKGAVSESRHVFIQHGLQKLLHLPVISTLEIGFGTGLNAFLSYLFAQKTKKEISYTAIDSHAIDLRVVSQLNYPSYLVADASKDIFLKMHKEDEFKNGFFSFKKYLSFDDAIVNPPADIIFFDAFSPDVHPQLWEQNIFDRLFELTAPGGYLVTYCAKGEIRRKIEKAGY